MGGLNTYAYVGGNPLIGVDPSGLICLVGVDPNCKLSTPGAIGPRGLGENTCFADDGMECPVDSPNAITPFDVAEVAAILPAIKVARTTIKAAQICSRAIAKNRDKICKSGLLIGSLFCLDKEGNRDPQDQVAKDQRTVEEITRKSEQSNLPNTPLVK